MVINDDYDDDDMVVMIWLCKEAVCLLLVVKVRRGNLEYIFLVVECKIVVGQSGI